MVIFCYHIKSVLIISNFLKIDEVIVSNWYQNLDEKLIRACVDCVLESLDPRLTHSCSRKKLFKKIKEPYKHKEKYKEDMEGIHGSAIAFIKKKTQVVNGYI